MFKWLFKLIFSILKFKEYIVHSKERKKVFRK